MPMEYDLVLENIGGFGLFQWLLFIGLSFFSFQLLLELHIFIMATYTPKFNCELSNHISFTTSHNFTINADQCSFTIDNGTQVFPCKEFQFDKTFFDETLVTEFNLVCDKKDYPQHLLSIFVLGSLVAIILAHGLDKLGRQKAIWFVGVWITCVEVGITFMPGLKAQFILRFCQGCSVCIFSQCLILLSETTPFRLREYITANFWLAGSFGYMISPLIAYLCRRWRKIMLYVSLLNVILIGTFAITPESPRWLLLKNKPKRAILILKRIAHINRCDVASVFLEENLICQNEPIGNLREFFTHRILLIKTLVIIFIYWTLGCIFGAFVFDLNIASSNIFVNVFLMALFELPAPPTAGFLTHLIGRKPSAILYLVISTICLVTIPFLSDISWQKWCKLVFALIGKLAIASVNVVGDVMRAEIFPTTLRSAGFSITEIAFFCSLMVTPYILALKDVGFYIPALIFAMQNIISVVLMLVFLPETKGMLLPDTADQANNMIRGKEKELLARQTPSCKDELYSGVYSEDLEDL